MEKANGLWVKSFEGGKPVDPWVFHAVVVSGKKARTYINGKLVKSEKVKLVGASDA